MKSIEALPGERIDLQTGQPGDDELVARIRGGETRLFAELVRRHKDSVFGMAARLLGSREEAEDAAQEVFLRAYRGIGGFRGDAKLSTWLFRITCNLCADMMRRRKRSGSGAVVEDALEDVADARTDSEAEALKSEERLAVWRALGCMDGIYRSVLVLLYIQDLSYCEISSILGVPLKTVETRAYRARKLLREALVRAGREGR